MKKIGNVSSKLKGFVFVDRNDDGHYSPWEARATVSDSGSFRLDGNKSALTGVLVHGGGTDAYSGTPNNVYYKAPSASKVMNALTTVAVELKEDMAALALQRWEALQAAEDGGLKGSGFGGKSSSNKLPQVTYADAAKKLLSAFDAGGLSIFKQDAYALLSAGKLKNGSAKELKALNALKLDLKLELLLDLGSSVLNSIDLAPSTQYVAQEGMVQAIVDKVINGQKIDFGEVTHISDAILSGGVAAETFGSFEEAPFGYVYGMSTVIAELMTYIDGYVDEVIAKGKGATGADVQGMLVKIKHAFVIASDVAIEIERAWLAGSSLDVLQQYTGNALQQLLGGSPLDPGTAFSLIGRDQFSMTSGDDIWFVRGGVPGEAALQKIVVTEPILAEHQFVLELADGTRIEVGPLDPVGPGETALELLAEALSDNDAGFKVSALTDVLLIEYLDPGYVGQPATLYQGVLVTTGSGETETEEWITLGTFAGSVLKTGFSEVASYSPANMNGFDQLLNFSVGSDCLDLPVVDVMSAGVYGNVQIGSRGIVTAVVDPDNGGPMSDMELGAIVESILNAMGTSRSTAAFNIDGNAYVVQGDGMAGMQDSDILIELTGVQLQDLSSILI